VYKFLKKEAGGGELAWNYQKFLVGRDGMPVKRYGAPFNLKVISADVDALIAGKFTSKL